MKGQNLYFVAIIPPKELEAEVYDLKILIKDQFNSERSLNSPAHITLIPPFFAAAHHVESIREELPVTINGLNSFLIKLVGFDYFIPRVIFINVFPSFNLSQLHIRLKAFFKSYDEIKLKFHAEYHPHMTIGFKDLRKKQFYEAKEYFDSQRFTKAFEVNGIWLLKHENGKWEKNQYFEFKLHND